MNEVLENIKSRRSVRGFKPDIVPQALIDQIIESGLYAPSGKNKQSAIIISVTDPGMIARITRMNREILGWGPDRDPFYGAPAMLIVLADRQFPNYLYDGSLVMGNLMLAAHSLGVGSCWIHRARQEFDSPEGKAILKSLGIEGDFEGIGHCALGYPSEAYPEAPPRNDHRVFYIK